MKAGLLGIGVCSVALCLAAQAGDRTRGRVPIQSPGSLQSVGNNTSTYDFRSQAYGLGSLGGPGAGGGAGVLRSNISGPEFSLRSNLSPAASSPLRSSITASGLGGRVGTSAAPAAIGGIGTMDRIRAGAGQAVPLIGSDSTVFGGAADIRRLILSANPALNVGRQYLHSVGPTRLTGSPDASKPISSLVPSQPSLYAALLATGEKAFQRGRFNDAFSYFERASYIAPHAPETLLSLTHGRFATSSIAYAAASRYLRKALKYLPELPLVPLRPKLFYGSDSAAVSRYVQHLGRLEKHLANTPEDVDALFVLAYYRWFSGRTNDTKAALAGAMKIAIEDGDKEMASAISTFWAAMVRSKKVSGALRPAATSNSDKDGDGTR